MSDISFSVISRYKSAAMRKDKAIAPFQVLRSLLSFDSCDRNVIQHYNKNICLLTHAIACQ
ncbi:hypothetical protein [Nostoc sp.]